MVKKELFRNDISIFKVTVQIVAIFLMGQAGVLTMAEEYWLALAFAGVAGVLLIAREFIVKRL